MDWGSHSGRGIGNARMRAVLLLVAVALLVAGCSGRKVYPSPEAIAGHFPTPDVPSPTPPAPQSVDDVRIYLDVSPSMIGYVRGKANTASSPSGGDGEGSPLKVLLDRCERQGETVFQNVVYRLKTTATGVLYFREKIGPLDADDLWKYFQGQGDGFDGQSLIAEALQHAMDDRKKWAVAVLVTDGVQSDDRSNSPLIVQEKLKGWGGAWELVGIRSQFSGKIHSVRMPGNFYLYDSGWRDVEKFRPFYLLILARDEQTLANFRKGFLKDTFGGIPHGQDDFWQVYSPGAPLFEQFGIRSGNTRGWSGFDKISHKAAEAAPGGVPWVTVRRERNARGEAIFTIPMVTVASETPPLEARGKRTEQDSLFSFTLEEVSFPNKAGTPAALVERAEPGWLGDGPVPAPTRPRRAQEEAADAPGSDSAEDREDEHDQTDGSPPLVADSDPGRQVRCSPPKAARSLMVAWRVTCRPRVGQWTSPAWIERWSTNRDEERRNATRTYGLDKLVDGFQGQALGRVLGRFFVVVQEP